MVQSAKRIIAIKKAIKKRDGYKCVECGTTRQQHCEAFGQDLDVHRIVPGSKYTVDGGVTLCRPCHIKKPKTPYGTKPKGPQVTFHLDADMNMQVGVIAAQWGIRKCDVAKFIVAKHAKETFDEVVANMQARH